MNTFPLYNFSAHNPFARSKRTNLNGIGHRVHGPATHHAPFLIHPAVTPYHHGAAAMLVRHVYAQCGYDTTKLAYDLYDPHQMTLAAWIGDQPIATLTIGEDGAQGLLAETLYGDEVKTLRTAGSKLCEVTRLAVCPAARSPRVIKALFKSALTFGQSIFDASDVIIEVNPHHAPYYQHQFGFSQIGALKTCPRVNAPAVLLHQLVTQL